MTDEQRSKNIAGIQAQLAKSGERRLSLLEDVCNADVLDIDAELNNLECEDARHERLTQVLYDLGGSP